MRSFSPLFLLSSLIVLSGCNASFAPPIRSGQDGAPGRTHQGELEGSGTADYGLSGGPNLSYTVTDHVAVEGGVEANENWALGYAGTRLTATHREVASDRSLGAGPAADLGVGLGAGAGGVGKPVENHPFQNPAGGSYLTLGAAYWFPYVSLYTRTRLEQSFAANLPPTFWWSVTGGLELWYGPVSIFAATGGFGYSNDTLRITQNTHFEYWMPIEGGVAVHFDVVHHDTPEHVAPESSVALAGQMH
jgi:hypothetical protein